MVPSENLETKSRGGGEEVDRRLLRAREESVSHLFLICPETQRCREDLLKNKWSHIYEGTAIRKILILKNATELRKLGTSSHNVKCKLENQVEKAEWWVDESWNETTRYMCV
jgi:hypothetical protein